MDHLTRDNYVKERYKYKQFREGKPILYNIDRLDDIKYSSDLTMLDNIRNKNLFFRSSSNCNKIKLEKPLFMNDDEENVLSEIYKIQDNTIYYCDICNEVRNSSNKVVLTCKHNLCIYCLENIRKYSKKKQLDMKCPYCRDVIEKYTNYNPITYAYGYITYLNNRDDIEIYNDSDDENIQASRIHYNSNAHIRAIRQAVYIIAASVLILLIFIMID